MESVEYRGAIAKLWQNRGRIMNVYPSFRPGDEIRVVAPSTGWQRKRVDSYDRATRLLEGLGFRVSFGRNIRDTERFLTGSVAARLEDFHDAYRDTTVKAIMALQYSAREFERRFASLLQLPGMRQHLCGLLVGRFQPSSKVTMPDIIDIVRRAELGTMPVIADVDFGHTWPMLTLPIGGTVSISTKNNQPQFNLLKY